MEVFEKTSPCEYHFSNGFCYFPSSPCQYSFSNGSCYETLNPLSGQRFDFLVLNPNAPDCPLPRDILLWFATYNLFTVVAALGLGSDTFRRYALCRDILHRRRRPPTQVGGIVASVALQVAVTIGTAYALRDGDDSADMSFLTSFLFARPLATPLKIWLALFDMGDVRDLLKTDSPPVTVDMGAYMAQSVETAAVDSIVGMVSLYAFGVVADATNTMHRPADLSPERWVRDATGAIIAVVPTTPNKIAQSYRMAQAGALLGLMVVVLQLLSGLWKVVWRPKGNIWDTSDSDPASQWRQLQFVLHIFGGQALRSLACWLLWAGLLNANPTAFCPSKNGLLKVMGIMMCAPIADNLIRGIFVRGKS